MILTVQDPFASEFARVQFKNKYSHTKSSGHKEIWGEMTRRVVGSVVAPYMPNLVDPLTRLIESRKFMPGGRYLASSGRRYPQINNCFLFRAQDSREGWAELGFKCTSSLMTGGGIGVVYSDVRAENEYIEGMGGHSTGPLALMQIQNEAGRHIKQGGSRRSAIWAGLHWWHKDVFQFIKMKDWPEVVKQQKAVDYNFPATMDGTNISVILDDDFFIAYRTPGWSKTYRTGQTSYTVTHQWARDAYWNVVRSMLINGEPGFSIDTGDNTGENLRNACTEVTSSDDSDMCNLASWNLARFDSLQEFQDAQPLGAAFLLCGSLYSKLPIENMYRVREKNRRLGLGLMGLHEWLLKRGYRYGPNPELGQWMTAYAQSGAHANLHCDRLGISRPVATRALAPTGTISIVGETTSGCEPIYAVAYKRLYLDGSVWKGQYVVDAAAQRLIQSGVDPSLIEDAYTLAEDVERRINFQAWLQTYVDHGISSTINLPAWGSEHNNESLVSKFGNTLMDYLPDLRGITAYPDGSRGGQPLTRMRYEDVKDQVGIEFIDHSEHSCVSGVCGN